MLDAINNQEVEHDCPNCGKKFKFTLKNLGNGDTVKCRYCNQSIKLETDNKSKKEFKEMQKSVKSLEKSLKNFGKNL